jgi:hypothetical protein
MYAVVTADDYLLGCCAFWSGLRGAVALMREAENTSETSISLYQTKRRSASQDILTLAAVRT